MRMTGRDNPRTSFFFLTNLDFIFEFLIGTSLNEIQSLRQITAKVSDLKFSSAQDNTADIDTDTRTLPLHLQVEGEGAGERSPRNYLLGHHRMLERKLKF